MMTTNEEWISVVWPYEVSSLGRVRNSKTGRLLKPNKSGNNGGYAMVRLYVQPKQWDVQVHNLVLWAFVGSRPPGFEPDHINRVRDDNRIENLRWISREENRARIIPNPLRGESVPTSKLSRVQVREIRNTVLAVRGDRARLARKMGVSGTCIDLIRKGINWKEMGEDETEK